MACGGFICSKNSLCALNLLYMLVSLLTIALAAWGKWFGLVSSFPVVAAIIGVGVFLFIVATVGLCGQCEPCSVKLQAHVEDALNVVGGVSLFFSFTEILGVWLSYRYRNQKDPRSNPGAFI
uniref:Uncharacterized protein n=1 Tax=Electrophorus electricus TaxID=8005 RepID=A0A4W4E6Z3_ELEEL